MFILSTKKKFFIFSDFRHVAIMSHFADSVWIKILDNFADYKSFASFGQVILQTLNNFADLDRLKNLAKLL